MNSHPTPLDHAAWQLELAHKEEERARQHRLLAEQAVIELIGTKEEGTLTAKTDFFKVSTVASYTRSLTKDWQDIFNHEDGDVVNKVIRLKPEVSITGLRELATTDPEAYRRVAKAIITKPSKIAVKVEAIQQEAA